MKAPEEFAVGKHDITWIDKRFADFAKEASFEKKQTPTFQKLPRYMKDAEIESELTPGICDLGDVLAFIENPLEGTKDGRWNLFYFPAFVVSVRWDGGGWRVGMWGRSGGEWGHGDRVFSPATTSTPMEFVTQQEFQKFKEDLIKLLSV